MFKTIQTAVRKALILSALVLTVVGTLGLATSAQAYSAVFSRNLSYGTTTTDVSSLQQFLADEGDYSGSITATFGPLTERGLMAFQASQGISATGYFGPATRAAANAIMAANPNLTTTLSGNGSYTNVNGNNITSPSYSSNGVPAGATAECKDGTYSFSQHRSGTCSGHHGVSEWLSGR